MKPLRGRVCEVALLIIAGWQTMAWGQNPTLFTQQEREWIAAHPVLNVAVHPDWRPLEYVEDGVYKGLSAEYFDAISRVSGLQFLWQGMGWAQARAAIIEGSADILPTTSQLLASEQLRKLIVYSKPYFVGSTLIVTQAASPMMFDPRGLDGKPVAVKGGGAYERFLKSRYPDIRLIPVDTVSEGLSMVARGGAYAIIDVDAVLIPIMQQQYFDSLHVAGSIAEMPAVLSIGAHVENHLLISIIDKSLASLTASETDRMLTQWTETANYGPPALSATLKYYYRELLVVVTLLIIIVFLLIRAYTAQRQAQRSERDKAMLLAVMSHEIRTPMNAILSSVELLGRAPQTPEDAELTTIAVTSANTLLALLDGALDFSRLEAGKVAIACQPTDVRALIAEAVSICEFRAEEKNLPLKMCVHWDAPLWLNIDALRVRQVLINLLSNAIKFTEAGMVGVHASFEQDPLDAARGTLHMTVSDTGIGVSRCQQQRLFKAFTQADESVTRKYGGTGLGLTICRQLLLLMGGTIELRSEPEAGTIINVHLPVLVAEAQSDNVENDFSIAAQPGIGACLSVLVVEDHPQNQIVIGRQLQALGHQICQALTGQEGLEQFALETFDIVLLDCNLPDIDGYAVARQMREQQTLLALHTPIIAISAMVGEAHSEACLDAGFDGVLVKPLRFEQLREVIDLWCEVQSGPSANVLLELIGMEDMQQAFFESCRVDLEEVVQARKDRDWLRVSTLAHRIAGASLIIDFAEIVAAARHLETLAKKERGDQAIDTAIEDLKCLLMHASA